MTEERTREEEGREQSDRHFLPDSADFRFFSLSSTRMSGDQRVILLLVLFTDPCWLLFFARWETSRSFSLFGWEQF